MEVIYPGETAFQEFTIPFAAENVYKAMVSYKQGYDIRLIKIVDRFIPDEEDEGKCKFSYTLSQAESLRLLEDDKCEIQVNVIEHNHNRCVSVPIRCKCDRQHVYQYIPHSVGEESHIDTSGEYIWNDYFVMNINGANTFDYNADAREMNIPSQRGEL